jgi:hypothetical protein
MFRSIQEQEQADYEMGMATEQQNAYAWSMMNRKPDDKSAAEELVALGRYVVISEHPIFCPSTDASMGVATALLGDYETHDEAVEFCRGYEGSEDEYVRILTPTVVVLNPPVPLTDDDIPF